MRDHRDETPARDDGEAKAEGGRRAEEFTVDPRPEPEPDEGEEDDDERTVVACTLDPKRPDV